VAEALEFGMIGLNTGAIFHRSRSIREVSSNPGLGREGAQFGIEEYFEMLLSLLDCRVRLHSVHSWWRTPARYQFFL